MKEEQPPTSFPHRERLAEALRGLCAEIVACDAPEEIFREAAETAEAFTRKLEREPRRVRRVGKSIQEEIRTIGKRYHYGDLIHFRPMAGFANPQASLLIYTYLDPGAVTLDEGTADRALRADSEPAEAIQKARPTRCG